MAFDRVWELRPAAAGLPDDTSVGVWVDLDRGDAAVTPFILSTAGEVPVSARTARLRWRPGVSTRSTLTDSEGNVWAVQDLREIGRRKWIDLSIVTVDVQSGLDVRPTAAPSSWQLRDGTGAAVLHMTPEQIAIIYTTIGPILSGGYGFRLWLPADWTFAGQWDPTARIGCEVGGIDSWLTFVKGVNATQATDGDAGTLNDIDRSETGSDNPGFFSRQPLVARRTRQRVWPWGDLYLYAARRDTGAVIWADTVVHGLDVVNF